MDKISKFWQAIADDIGETVKNGHPFTWDQKNIKAFLVNFEEKIADRCNQDPSLAKVLNIQTVPPKSGYAPELFSIDPVTFRRIIIDRKSKGKAFTKNLFAIYLGYQSFQDYIAKKEITGEIKKQSHKQKFTQSFFLNISWKNSSLLVGCILIIALFTEKLTALLSNPLIIIGLALLLIFGIYRLVILSGLLPPIPKEDSTSIVGSIIKYGSLLAAISIVIGGALTFSDVSGKKTRNQVARSEITKEVLDNMLTLSFQIKSMHEYPLEKFTDIRPRFFDQSKSEYLNLMHQHYRDYYENLKIYQQDWKYNTRVYDAHRGNLTSTKVAGLISNIYRGTEKIKNTFEQLITQLQSINKNFEEDDRIFDKSAYKIKESLLIGKIELGNTARYALVLVNDQNEVAQINNYLLNAGFLRDKEVELKDDELNKIILTRMAELEQARAELIASQSPYPMVQPDLNLDSANIDEVFKSLDSLTSRIMQGEDIISNEESKKYLLQHAKRKVPKVITDPTIKHLRRLAKLSPDTLSDAEWIAIMYKTIDTVASDVETLISLTFTAYIEGDQNAVEYYLEKLLENKDLNELQRKYAIWSLERVRHPDIFDGSLGIMIFKVHPGGIIEKAGLQAGDILSAVNGEVLQGPDEINALMSNKTKGQDHFLVYYRDGNRSEKGAPAGYPIGADVAPLIAFFPYTY
ncbi:MAG: PDZ domain-containing protein [Chitinophagales bacterium]|nr:PDZ domain-containing protein [Chitinophagales bacterium]